MPLSDTGKTLERSTHHFSLKTAEHKIAQNIEAATVGSGSTLDGFTAMMGNDSKLSRVQFVYWSSYTSVEIQMLATRHRR